MKVLSIDDSRAVHSFLKDCVRDTKAELDTAADGKAGLEKLKDAEYDLVFLDWEMPGMQGPEVLQEIIDIKAAQCVIMLTTKNDFSDISKVLEIGAKDYIMKPFTPDLIIEKIEAVTGQSVR